MTADMPMAPREMWDHVSNLSELGDWLVIHEGWRSELPDEITEGTQIVGAFQRPAQPGEVDGDEVGSAARGGDVGIRQGRGEITVTRSVRSPEGGSTLGTRLELGGRALFGPVGSAAARAVRGDVEKSLKQFVELYG
jgi:hypothetical protein